VGTGLCSGGGATSYLQWHPNVVPEQKDKDEIDRLRSIVSPVREDLERSSRVQKALARLRLERKKEEKPGEKDGSD